MLKIRILLILAVMLGSITLVSPTVATAEGRLCKLISAGKSAGGRASVRWTVTCPKRESAKTTQPRNTPRTERGPAKKPKLTEPEWRALMGMCRRMNQTFTCSSPPDQKLLTRVYLRLDLGAMAKTLVTRLQLPDPTPQIGPDPTANEWRMAAVGYPLWLWTEGPRTVTSRVRSGGITFTLRATWLSTTFGMGDGHSVTCTRATEYSRSVRPGAKSPDCGYTYRTSSLPKGNYTVTATTNWRISWAALGETGSLPGSHSGSRSLPVGELNALVVR